MSIATPGTRGACSNVSLRRSVFASKMSLPDRGPTPPTQPRARYASCCSARKSLRMVGRRCVCDSRASAKSANIGALGERISMCHGDKPDRTSCSGILATSYARVVLRCRACARRDLRAIAAVDRIACGFALVTAPSRAAACRARRARWRVTCHCAISNTVNPASTSAKRQTVDSSIEAPHSRARAGWRMDFPEGADTCGGTGAKQTRNERRRMMRELARRVDALKAIRSRLATGHRCEIGEY